MIKDSHHAFRFINNNEGIVKFIFDTLERLGYDYSDLNFETIINVIEDLIVHYAFFDGTRKLPSLSKAFFSPRFDPLNLDFSVKGGYQGHGFRLEIPRGSKSFGCSFSKLLSLE